MLARMERMATTPLWVTLALGALLALGLPRPAVGQVSFAMTDFPTGVNPQAVAVADLNEDGHPDLVVANNGANTVSVLLGTSTGSFGARTDFPTGGPLRRRRGRPQRGREAGPRGAECWQF